MNSTSPSGAATVANIAYCYVLPVICAIGVIGNITNLIVLASRRLRAVSYMYLRALAVADLLCMIFVLLFVTTEILTKNGAPINQYRLYQIYQCHFMLTLINWALGAGVYLVVALSLERYISIVFPLHFRAWNSPQRASKAIIIAFVIPALLYIPYAFTRYKSVEKWDHHVNATIYKIDDHQVYRTIQWQIYKWTRETILRFLPIIILSVLNIQIMIAFRRRQKMFQQLTKRKEQGTHKVSMMASMYKWYAVSMDTFQDDTLMYMLGGTVFMSLLCNIPAAINLLLIDEALKQRLDYQIFRAVANILEITNHASQFYVFCACSTDYRTTFLQKFPCFKKAYANRSHLRSFAKRTHSAITRDKDSSDQPTTSPKVYFVSKLQLRIYQGHSDSASCERKLVEKRIYFRERTFLSILHLLEHQYMRKTIDVHLASAEESLSDGKESDSLIRYGGAAIKPFRDANGSTLSQ
uniref:G_PROTEIN_RECEP_F1_2 domain-containing protein n=1 Tax=Angiostrongylus cantonensis TaxID=6313 RepID=A0A0K0D3J2_ANGCA